MPNYTDLLDLFKPVVGGDYNNWGGYLNSSMDRIDEAVISSNFAQNAASHSGLNFYYKEGRILNENTLVTVVAGNVVLTDSSTNYVEVSTAGVVSKNVVGFTKGAIPLYQVTTAAGAMTNIVDKRGYIQVNFTDIKSMTSNVIDIDADGNVLVNEATAETSSEKALSIKQGVDPTTSTADQISIFATAGADSTLGLRTEQAVTNNVLRANINGTEKYIHTRASSCDPLSSFIYTNNSVTNTTDETTIITMTLPARTSPAGQHISLKLFSFLTTAVAAHTCTITIYVGADTMTYLNNTASTYSNYDCRLYWDLYIKSTTAYVMTYNYRYGGYTGTAVSDFTDDFTTDTILKVTATWSVADAGNVLETVAGAYEVKN